MGFVPSGEVDDIGRLTDDLLQRSSHARSLLTESELLFRHLEGMEFTLPVGMRFVLSSRNPENPLEIERPKWVPVGPIGVYEKTDAWEKADPERIRRTRTIDYRNFTQPVFLGKAIEFDRSRNLFVVYSGLRNLRAVHHPGDHLGVWRNSDLPSGTRS